VSRIGEGTEEMDRISFINLDGLVWALNFTKLTAHTEVRFLWLCLPLIDLQNVHGALLNARPTSITPFLVDLDPIHPFLL
jgi:hypothetical protein